MPAFSLVQSREASTVRHFLSVIVHSNHADVQAYESTLDSASSAERPRATRSAAYPRANLGPNLALLENY